MLISDARRALFVHVQKTGGVTVQSMLEQALPDGRHLGKNRHATLAQILHKEPDLAGYWTFGFVRNPWARMVSWYDMAVRFRAAAERGSPGETKQLLTNGYLRKVAYGYSSFDEFVMCGPDEFPRLRTPQVDYLSAAERKVDFIGRTESLADDIRHVFDHLGLPAPETVPQKNANKEKVDYRERYTPLTREQVARVFRRDLDELGYEF
ncbi:sulfotransferase family 2 domain-containing protein [Nocardioides ferulae]|uniref:sulfotransferase family 2 domain-containing protein n=1 Tax=Nocardioides ferulae TaxID=2340821 RepID=UPI000EAC6E8F|nr:sulfotransferase family 2 domain-containing protein [Nocardioides ferulae]